MYENILTRYQQAQALIQGILSKKVVLNDAVFPHWIKASDCFWYERGTLEGKEYRLVDAAIAKNTIAFDHQALADALEKALEQKISFRDLPITVIEITLSPLQVFFKAFNQQWLFDSDKGTCEKKSESTPVEGLLSPDGTKLAFVRNFNLWVRDLNSGEERALTQDGAKDYHYAGAATPFGIPSTQEVQVLWSPDSQCLLTHQLDMRQVESRSIVHHVPQDGSIRPQLFEYKAAYPGDRYIESYRILSIDINSGKIQVANYKSLPLCRLGSGFFSQEKLGWWANDSRCAFFIDVSRGAKTVRVVKFDTHTGTTELVLEETSRTSIKLSHTIIESPIFLPLPESDELIWFSERTGWAHLYLYDLKAGKLKHSITGGKPSFDRQWLVRDVLHIDINRRELLIQTAGRDPAISPYYRDICCVNIDTGKIIPLADGPYEHIVFTPDSPQVRTRSTLGLDSPNVSGISPNGNYLVTTRSRVDKVPVSLLIDRDGKEILTLEIANLFGLPDDWQWPEPVKLTSADDRSDIYGIVYRPPGFSPKQLYPILDFSCGYPGYSYVPQASFISGTFSGEPYLLGAAYAALGFVVVALEGRGTPCRHKDFQDISYGNITSANAFDDRISGLRQLAKRYPYMDLDRVGLIGCDGITSPVLGLLEYPDFYKVGVIVALEDSRLIIASINELFEGIAVGQTSNCYPESLVESLKGKLLLIHGMLDSVTPPAATFRLIDSLQKANKNFDLLLLPNDGHEVSTYAQRRTWDYLVTHLQNIPPPEEFNLITAWDLLYHVEDN